jgi:hypothetical protein
MNIPDYERTGIIVKCPCCRTKRDSGYFFGVVSKNTYKCFKCNEYARALRRKTYVPTGRQRGRPKIHLKEDEEKEVTEISD